MSKIMELADEWKDALCDYHCEDASNYRAALQAEVERMEAAKEHYMEQWSEVCNENQKLLNEIAALREALRKTIRLHVVDDECWDVSARVEKAMQQAIDSARGIK